MNYKLIFFAFSILIFANSCKDECDDVDCGLGTCDEGICTCPENYFGPNCETYCFNGTYENGSCSCDTGYEGEDCENISRDKFLGVWDSSSFGCAGDIDNETIEFFEDQIGIDRLILKDQDVPDITISCNVAGDTIFIPTQFINVDGDPVEVTGQAILENDVLNLNVTQSYMGNEVSCSGGFIKQ